MRFLVIIIFSIHHSILFSQSMKWGKVSNEEKEFKECTYEKDAPAIVLFKNASVEATSYVTFKIHIRMKILNKSGFEYSNIQLPFLSADYYENIENLKAQTINILDNGDISITEVDKKDIYTIKSDDINSTISFSFPNVREGSIIEYSYSVFSRKFGFLNNWIFDEKIPVLYSKFKANIARGRDYKVIYQGEKLLKKYAETESSDEWILEDLPSLKEEVYCRNIYDYSNQIKFQTTGYYKLSSEKFGKIQDYDYIPFDSWSKISDLVTEELENSDFSVSLFRTFGLLDTLISPNDNDEEKLKKIYNYVVLNYKWNNKTRIYIYRAFYEFYSSKSGSNSEINYFMYLLLKRAKLNVKLLLVRTKDLGLVQKSFPLFSQFNSLALYVELPNKSFIIDGTSPLRPYFYTSIENLNFYALILDGKNTRWTDIVPSKESKIISQLIIKIDNDKSLSYRITCKLTDYFAFMNRSFYLETKNDEDFCKKFVSNYLPYSDIDSFSISNKDNGYSPFFINLKIKQTIEQSTDSLLYIKPLVFNYNKENPFKLDERKYPVDFDYPFSFSYNATIEIPENYKIEETPKNETISLPDNSGKIIITYRIFNDKVIVTSHLQLTKSYYSQEYYNYLKEFFSHYINRSSDLIILRKL